MISPSFLSIWISELRNLAYCAQPTDPTTKPLVNDREFQS